MMSMSLFIYIGKNKTEGQRGDTDTKWMIYTFKMEQFWKFATQEALVQYISIISLVFATQHFFHKGEQYMQ